MNARVLWGEPRSDIEEWLTAEQGIAPLQAKSIIDRAMAERTREIRSYGGRMMLIGIGVCVVTGIGIVFQLLAPVIFVWIFGGTCLAFGFGLYKIIKGSIMMVGGRAKGAVADL